VTDEILDTDHDDDTAISRGGYFFAGLVLGAVVGATAALLLAPERGEVTRRRLARQFRELRDDAADELREAGRSARQEFRRRVRKRS